MTFSQTRQYIKGVLSNIFNKTLSNIAPKFNPNENYSIGDRVIYKGDLYRFTSAHTGAWATADANKTDINTLTECMPSTDMEEVASPLPGVMSRRMKYSLQEQVVGEWIDGKPIYQKTLVVDNIPTSGGTISLQSLAIDNYVSLKTISHNATHVFSFGASYKDPWCNIAITYNKVSHNLIVNYENYDPTLFILTIQYTKTTDTAS